ncbi:MAG: TIGR00297 family protein [Methanomethylovorans sp.]|uniref:TIGR00297 family protein n=1 Tax=Methanomethylovorans sp. TaxID=2758717 RepID=UPI003C70D754
MCNSFGMGDMNKIENITKEIDPIYIRHLLHASLGLTCLLYPFLPLGMLILIMFLMIMILRHLPQRSKLYQILSSKENDKNIFKRPIDKNLRSANNLVISILLLLLFKYGFSLEGVTFPIYVIGGAVAISTFGIASANMFTHWKKNQLKCLAKLDYPEKTYKEEEDSEVFHLPSSLVMLLAGIISAFLLGAWIIHWEGINVTYDMIFFIAVIGSVTGALFESIPSRVDDNISVVFGSGMVMWLFASFGYTVPPAHMFFALLFSLLLGYLAYRARIADISALLGASLIGVLIIVFADIFCFLLLLTFFILGGVFTKYKYAYKASIGIAEKKGGVRSYENVFSNSMAALVLAIAYGMYPQYSEFIMYSYLGTVATATGDTLASEIGTTSKERPRMITNLKPARPGRDGAVTILGELACIFGSLVIAVLAILFGKVENAYLGLLITGLGGFIGTNIDSLLGATLQNRGILSNSGVNFYANFAGAAVSGLLFLSLS